MSQIGNLPSIKKIELTVRQMQPPLNRDGTRPAVAGIADDGSPIYYGDIFDGHPAFRQNGEDGHERVPAIGPDGEVWRLNKATGQKIVQVFQGKRTYSKRRFMMKDFGNGNAGPIPVPVAPEGKGDGNEFDTLKAVLAAEGMTMKDLVAAIRGSVAEKPAEVPAEVEVDDSVNEGSVEPPKKRRGRPPKVKDDSDG